MRYLSLFSGIEAASAAWEPLGWKPVAFAEIDPFCCRLLKNKWPDVPNLGDVRDVSYRSFREPFDVLVGGSPCFTGDTMVLTSHGYVPIKDVREGDLVLTHMGRWRKVLKTGHREAPTVFVKGQGALLHTTEEHPVWGVRKLPPKWDNTIRRYPVKYTDPSWIKAGELAGNLWASPAQVEPLPVPEPVLEGNEVVLPRMSEALMWLAGRYLADGWTRWWPNRRRGAVIIACGKAKFDATLEELKKTGLHWTVCEQRTAIRLQCSSRSLARWCETNFGKGAAEKSFPAWAFGMPMEYRLALFEGYMRGDGSVDKRQNELRATTVSWKLALGLKLLAQSLGFSVSLSRVKTAPQRVIEGRVVNQRPSFLLGMRLRLRTSFFKDRWHFGRVRSVTPGETETVYNLEVEEDNSYTADDICVHNCQSTSQAGKREGMKGESGLVREFLRVVEDFRPRIAVWENVPGALTADKGAFFRHVLRHFQRLGYGVAWRVLDAQYFGVPQRRRRVFLVGVLGDDFRAGEILFEPEVLCGPSETGQSERPEHRPGAGENSGETGRFVGRGFQMRITRSEECPTITRRVSSAPDVVVIDIQANRGIREYEGITPTLTSRMGTGGNNVPALAEDKRLRRLTPEECERLMGLPTGWTAIPDEKGKPACDSARYKALGNSMAVPVMAWIGRRIEKVMGDK